MTLLEGTQHFLVIIVIFCPRICTNCVFAGLKFLVTNNLIGVGYPTHVFVIHREALVYIFLHPLYFSVFSDCDIFYFLLFHTLLSL